MTKLTGFRKAALTVAAVLILVLFATGPATFGGEGEETTLELQTFEVHGSQVEVKVANTSSNAMTVSSPLELPPGGDLGQPRIGWHLDPPPLVLGEMPMKRIELVQRGEIDESFHLVLGEEVPADIEVNSTPAKARAIDHLAGRDSSFIVDELKQRLHAVEQPGASGRRQRDSRALDIEPIVLVPQVFARCHDE